jgi:hypothetical protein
VTYKPWEDVPDVGHVWSPRDLRDNKYKINHGFGKSIFVMVELYRHVGNVTYKLWEDVPGVGHVWSPRDLRDNKSVVTTVFVIKIILIETSTVTLET